MSGPDRRASRPSRLSVRTVASVAVAAAAVVSAAHCRVGPGGAFPAALETTPNRPRDDIAASPIEEPPGKRRGGPRRDAMRPRGAYGMVTQTWDPVIAGKMRELGARWVALDFNWYEIEPEQDRFDWDLIQPRVDGAIADRRRILATLAYSPGWAARCRARCAPRDVGDFEDFVGRVLQRYGSLGRNIAFAIWNEPNGRAYLDDDEDATTYAELVRAADRARRAVNPDAVLVGPNTAHHAVSHSSYYRNAMLLVGHHFDKVAVHWYADGPPLAAYMHAVQAQAAGRNVWLTETGFNGSDRAQVVHYRHVLETFESLGRTWWTKVFFYNLLNFENRFTIVTPGSGTSRPAFLVYRDWIVNHP